MGMRLVSGLQVWDELSDEWEQWELDLPHDCRDPQTISDKLGQMLGSLPTLDEPTFRRGCQAAGHAHLMHLTTIHPDPTHLTLSESLEASCEATAVRHGGAVPECDSGA
jgi:hypothetical protein